MTSLLAKVLSTMSKTAPLIGYHLAKLRWYCENIGRVTPSRWNMQDVEEFYKFLEDLPEVGLCAMRDGRYALPGEAGYTPFRKRPAKSSQADIQRFVHALFKTWNSMGYIRINPMALTGTMSARKINVERSLGHGSSWGDSDENRSFVISFTSER